MKYIEGIVLFFNVLFLLINIFGMANQHNLYKVINNILPNNYVNADTLIYNKNDTYNVNMIVIILVANCVLFVLHHVNEVFLFFYSNLVVYVIFVGLFRKKSISNDVNLTVLKINNSNSDNIHFDIIFHEPSRIRYVVGCVLAIVLFILNIIIIR